MHKAKGNKSAAKDHWHLVAFWFWSMSPAEQNYAIGNEEMLAIIMSSCYWRHYLRGAKHPVEALTDRHNLERFRTTKSLRHRQAHWWEIL